MRPIPSPSRLADVAKRAGVSAITASRALRLPEKVAPETRRRVELAAEALGYVPNLVAGALASARSRVIAVLLPTITSSIFATTITGLTEVLEAEGYAILMAQSGYDAAREKRVLAALLGRRPEGVVMIGSPMTAEAASMLATAAKSGTMVAETWDLPAEPIGFAVGFDNAAVGAAAADYFIRGGRRRLAFIGGADTRAKARWRGFEAAAHQAGLPVSLTELPAPAAMANALDAYLAAKPPEGLASADAIFAATDIHAAGLLTALRACGKRVPDDVAVIGLGDLELAHHVIPSLTTIRIDGMAMGQRAAALALAGIGGMEPPVHTDLGFELIRRESG
jgi:LacI family gluconate utilization system Gnt-I transcriptional repressor